MTLARRVSSSRYYLRDLLIPTIPDTLIKLDKAYSSKLVNRSDIVDIIKQDSVVSGELIKAVNSKKFNLKAEVESIDQALSIIGIDNPDLLNIVRSSTLKSVLQGSKEYVSTKEVFEYCADIAFLFFEIATFTGNNKHQAYTLGLFLDIGYLVLSSKNRSYVELYLKSLSNPEKALQDEVLIGADHASVGFIVAENWCLPRWMQLAILCHHENIDRFIGTNFDERAIDLIAISKIATYISAEVSFGCYIGKEIREQKDLAKWHLGLTDDDLSEIRRTFIVDSINCIN